MIVPKSQQFYKVAAYHLTIILLNIIITNNWVTKLQISFIPNVCLEWKPNPKPTVNEAELLTTEL